MLAETGQFGGKTSRLADARERPLIDRLGPAIVSVRPDSASEQRETVNVHPAIDSGQRQTVNVRRDTATAQRETANIHPESGSIRPETDSE